MLSKDAILLLSFGAASAIGALYNSPSELPTGKTYDYIVVGCEDFFSSFKILYHTDSPFHV